MGGASDIDSESSLGREMGSELRLDVDHPRAKK
jgi:hypothetical protein